MTEENKDDYVMVFEAPKIAPPEFRLYYNEENGRALFYTCEKPEGKYVIVDTLTFACARHDVIVIDGRIVNASPSSIVSKLVIDNEGIECLKEDVSIIVTEDTDIETQFWKLKTYEL